MVSRRYGRAQFIKDATWLGLAPDAAFSRTELRRRRDRLMNIHHPDRGGDAAKAARINAIYARMTAWLDSRGAVESERRGPNVSPAAEPGGQGGVFKSGLSAAFHAGAAQICAVAMVALATYAAFRGNRKP
ncbi:hypothetical protein [Rhodoblastus sp.]|uniref:hypothetical protein n=1 Tax=Rhodoblastus sp. TaxID=1962975 RepID=UPI0035B1B983